MDEKVLDRAVEAGKGPWFAAGIDMNHPEADLRYVLAAAVPVIVAAAVKEAKARVEAAAEAFDGQRDRANWNDPFREGKSAGFRAALAAIDKEGEGE